MRVTSTRLPVLSEYSGAKPKSHHKTIDNPGQKGIKQAVLAAFLLVTILAQTFLPLVRCDFMTLPLFSAGHTFFRLKGLITNFNSLLK